MDGCLVMDRETEAFMLYAEQVDEELLDMTGIRLWELPEADATDRYYESAYRDFRESEHPGDAAMTMILIVLGRDV